MVACVRSQAAHVVIRDLRVILVVYEDVAWISADTTHDGNIVNRSTEEDPFFLLERLAYFGHYTKVPRGLAGSGHQRPP
jgi:hypothetical protein